MRAVTQWRIIPNLDLDLIFNKRKNCGVLEKLNKNHVVYYSNQHVLLVSVSKFD